jgi:hypothetical protein
MKVPSCRATLVLGVATWLFSSVAGCTTQPDYPPVESNLHEGGTGGNNSGGGGGGTKKTECAAQGGMCLLSGNECPNMLGENLCGPSSDGEGGPNSEICCNGFDDAGAPDAAED